MSISSDQVISPVRYHEQDAERAGWPCDLWPREPGIPSHCLLPAAPARARGERPGWYRAVQKQKDYPTSGAVSPGSDAGA